MNDFLDLSSSIEYDLKCKFVHKKRLQSYTPVLACLFVILN